MPLDLTQKSNAVRLLDEADTWLRRRALAEMYRNAIVAGKHKLLDGLDCHANTKIGALLRKT